MIARFTTKVLNSFWVRFFRSYAWALVFYTAMIVYGCFRYPFEDRIQAVIEVSSATCTFGIIMMIIWSTRLKDNNLQVQWSQIVTLGMIVTTSLIVGRMGPWSIYMSIFMFILLMFSWIYSPTHKRDEKRLKSDYLGEMQIARFIALAILFLSTGINAIMLLSSPRDVAENVFACGLGFASFFLFIWGMFQTSFATFVEECMEALFEFTPLFTTLAFIFQNMELWQAVLLSIGLVVVRGFGPYRCRFWNEKNANSRW